MYVMVEMSPVSDNVRRRRSDDVNKMGADRYARECLSLAAEELEDLGLIGRLVLRHLHRHLGA